MRTSVWIRGSVLGAAVAAVLIGGLSHAQDAGAPPARGTAQRRPMDRPPEARPPQPMDALSHFRDQFEGVDLSDEQLGKIQKLIDKAQHKIENLVRLDPEIGHHAAPMMMGLLNEDVQSILTDAQKQSIRDHRQRRMLDHIAGRFSDPRLKITDEQQQKMKQAIDEAKRAMTATEAKGAEDRAGARQMLQALSGLYDKLDTILTPEQKDQISHAGGPAGGRGPIGPDDAGGYGRRPEGPDAGTDGPRAFQRGPGRGPAEPRAFGAPDGPDGRRGGGLPGLDGRRGGEGGPEARDEGMEPPDARRNGPGGGPDARRGGPGGRPEGLGAQRGGPRGGPDAPDARRPRPNDGDDAPGGHPPRPGTARRDPGVDRNGPPDRDASEGARGRGAGRQTPEGRGGPSAPPPPSDGPRPDDQ